MPRSERRSSSSDALAGAVWSRTSPSPVAAGSSVGARSVSRNTSASTRSSAVLPRDRMRSGTHGSVVGMVMWTGVPSPIGLAALQRGIRVEAGGQEDGAPLGVEVEHLGRVGRQPEAVLRWPRRRPRHRRP